MWLGLLVVILVEPLRFAPVLGASMEPTLEEGDLVCFQRLDAGELPERGSIVVFHSPLDPARLFVKRLVGLPGDVLRFESGELRVNGVPYPLKPAAHDPPSGHVYVPFPRIIPLNHWPTYFCPSR